MLNPGALAFVPGGRQTSDENLPEVNLCHFGAECSNPLCAYLHSVDLGWNPKVQAVALDLERLQVIRERAAVQIAVDAEGHAFVLTGSRSSLHHAMDQLQDCLPCHLGDKCKNPKCNLCHQLVLPVRGVVNAKFLECPGNVAAIQKQTGVEIAWRSDVGELEVCGSQTEVFEAKQHLKRLTLCLYSSRCKNDSCPYWHSIDCDMTHPSLQAVPAGIINRFVSSVANAHGVEVANFQSSVNVSGLRQTALAAAEALTLCRYNDGCTNRGCAYLHVKQLPNYDGVEIGMLVGPGGQHVKDIEVRSGATVHVVTNGVCVIGSQNEVFQAEKLLRDQMFQSTKCTYGRACTNPKCLFLHPKSHSIQTAKAWAWRATPDQRLCKYGEECRFKRTCTFRHF